MFGRSVNQEFANECAKGFSEQAAAQNLFTRAVRAQEYKANLNKLTVIFSLWSLYNVYQNLTPARAYAIIDAPAKNILMGSVLWHMMIDSFSSAMAHILLSIIDVFGNFGQYSI